MITLDPGGLWLYLQSQATPAPGANVTLDPAALWLYLLGGIASAPAPAALYFFVNITQSGFKADNSPSSDTTLGGHA